MYKILEKNPDAYYCFLDFTEFVQPTPLVLFFILHFFLKKYLHFLEIYFYFFPGIVFILPFSFGFFFAHMAC